jgi:DNA-directed RNA polymerase subunit M/transcription elongation factor TFIIS
LKPGPEPAAAWSGEAMKIAKTADRKKVMDTTKSTDCPKCGKPTRIVKRVKDRERGISGGIFISCSGCEFYEKL